MFSVEKCPFSIKIRMWQNKQLGQMEIVTTDGWGEREKNLSVIPPHSGSLPPAIPTLTHDCKVIPWSICIYCKLIITLCPPANPRPIDYYTVRHSWGKFKRLVANLVGVNNVTYVTGFLTHHLAIDLFGTSLACATFLRSGIEYLPGDTRL